MDETSASVGRKVTGGTFWTVGVRWGTRLLGIVSTLILARLLVPEDFGIIAQAALIYEMLDLLTGFGLETALITNQRAGRDHYNTVWTIHACRGVAIGFVLLGLAYPLSFFFNEPALVSIMPCYALAAAILGFTNVGTVDFRKHFRFDLEFRYVLYRKMASFCVAMAAAVLLRNYWAFVLGVLADALTALASSYLMTTHRVRFTVRRWREFATFGGWMLMTETLGALTAKLDTLLLSRYSTAANLGLYTVSQEIGGMPSTEVAMPVARAVMPGLAKLSHDRQEYQSLYIGTLSLVMAIALPASFGLAAVAHPLVNVVLGTKWGDAAPLLQALAIYGVTRAITAVSTSAYLAFNRADLLAKLSASNLLIRACILPAGFYL